MIEIPGTGELQDLLEEIAEQLRGPDDFVSGDGSWIGERDVRVNDPAVDRLVHKLRKDVATLRWDADRLMWLMWHLYEDAPVVIAGAAPVQARDSAATVAILVTTLVARRGGLTLLGVTVDEYVEVLTNTYMDRDQRVEALQYLCRTGEQALTVNERPRPNPDAGPIISLGTPISFVDRQAQISALEVASAIEEMLTRFGMQADIPGRHIHPGSHYPEADLIERDKTARAALAMASGFIGIDAHLARRGMGFAVAHMEAAGAPVLLMPRQVEDFVFARVFGPKLSHREEVVYGDMTEAVDYAEAFLRDHRACITERHRDVLQARLQLNQTTDRLRRRMVAVDKTLFASARLTESRAWYLLSDPAHLQGAQKWEFRALSRLLNVPYSQLVADVMEVAPGELATGPTLPTAGRNGAGEQPRTTGRGGIGDAEYQAFRAAPELHPNWDHAKGLQLLDEYVEPVSPAQTAARPKKRTDARAWVQAYIGKFGQ